MNFQPFSVTCVTCGSQLRVRRPELIDSIVACPKCQSMVQLTRAESIPAPPGDQVGNEERLPTPPMTIGRAEVDSGAVTEDSISDDNRPGDAAVSAPPVEAESSSWQGEPSIDAPVELPPSQTWQSDRAARSKKMALIATIAVASILGLVVIAGALMRGGDDPKTVELADTVDETTEEQPDVSPQSDPDADGTATDADGTATDADDASREETEESNSPDDEAEATVSDPGSQGSDAESGEMEKEEGTAEQDPSADQPPADLLPDNSLLPENPLEGLLPPDPLGNPLAPPAADSNTESDEPTMTELPPEIKLLLDVPDLQRRQLDPNQATPPTIKQIELERAADVNVAPEVMVDPDDPINMKQALGIRFALSAGGDGTYPLNDLMLLISQLTSVPIEIDWVSFELVGTPINEPIAVPRKWLNAEEVLDAVCDAIDATYETKPRSIVLRPTDDRLLEVLNARIDFQDLGDKADSAVTVARQLLGQNNPAARDRVELPQNLGGRQLAGLVCEAIRAARGSDTLLTDEARSRWMGEYELQLERWRPLAGGISGPVNVQPAAFASIVRNVARLNGATCFVNWRDAANQQLDPIEPFMPTTGDSVSAAEALDAVLSQHQLIVREVDDKHWWVGVESSLDRFPVVIWFDPAGDATKQQQQLAEVIRKAGGQLGVPMASAIDPESGRCIAVLPRFLLRQLPRLLGAADDPNR